MASSWQAMEIKIITFWSVIVLLFVTGCTENPSKTHHYSDHSVMDTHTSDSGQQLSEPISDNYHDHAMEEEPQLPDTLELEKSLIAQGLVNIQNLAPDVSISLKYASTDNFLNEDVYQGLSRCYLQPEAALMLAKAQTVLTTKHPGLTLLIYDGARPQSVQYKMWEIVKNTPMEDYVAEPDRGSMHNYGTAVDLSLYHLDTGEVDMGTPYDHFGPLAQPRYETKYLESGELTQTQVNNRRILRAAMLEAGFSGILSEWWHFNAFPKDTVRKKYQLIR